MLLTLHMFRVYVSGENSIEMASVGGLCAVINTLIDSGTDTALWCWLMSSHCQRQICSESICKGKPSPYSITERRVPELIAVLGSQPAGDVSHKPDCRLPLLSARPAVTLATLKRAATSFAAW